MVIAGYASGHLRVFSASSGKIGAEATAHARCINAVDVASEKGLVSLVTIRVYLKSLLLVDTVKLPGCHQ